MYRISSSFFQKALVTFFRVKNWRSYFLFLENKNLIEEKQLTFTPHTFRLFENFLCCISCFQRSGSGRVYKRRIHKAVDASIPNR